MGISVFGWCVTSVTTTRQITYARFHHNQLKYFEMASDINEKCGDECSFDYSEDKQKGVCLIKQQYVIEEPIRLPNEPDSLHDVVNDNDVLKLKEPPLKKLKSDEKKEKHRGQNKARPPPFRASRESSICPWIADQGVGEIEKKCDNKKCSFLHDRLEYLKIKPKDVATDCHVFNLIGRCPRGLACRMGSKHLTEDGLNIVDEQKLRESNKITSSMKNYLSKDLQYKLRKRKYDFSKAEQIVKKNDVSRKKHHDESSLAKVESENGENNHSDNNSNTNDPENIVTCKEFEFIDKDPKIGMILDDDIIKLRSSEKKKIDWHDKILLSPLTTVGNLPFRRICKEYGADITCGEMALAPKILKGAHEEWALVKRHETEDIFGVQLCGNNPGVLTRCAQLLNEQISVDFIDLNLGCPIDLIYRQGGGSGMLNRLNVLENVIKSVSEVLEIPLCVKTRTGVYIDKPIAHNLMKKFRDWGASMITVHGRSREQRYTKLANWEYIEKCAQAAKPVVVFGNGDILSHDDYQRVKTSFPNVTGVTIGRGALIKPWIFTEIKQQKLIDISSTERFEILKKYSNYGLEHWGSDTRGIETTRRFMLEWISFLHRYVPVGLLERPPQRINERPPYYRGRDDLETLMASSNCEDWITISEMLLGKVPEGFNFLPKHKANSWK